MSVKITGVCMPEWKGGLGLPTPVKLGSQPYHLAAVSVEQEPFGTRPDFRHELVVICQSG